VSIAASTSVAPPAALSGMDRACDCTAAVKSPRDDAADAVAGLERLDPQDASGQHHHRGGSGPGVAQAVAVAVTVHRELRDGSSVGRSP